MSKMIRVSPLTNDRLDELSSQTGKSKQSLVEQAVEMLKRELFFQSCDKAYERLKKDENAWKEYQEGVSEWDATLMDGLEDE